MSRMQRVTSFIRHWQWHSASVIGQGREYAQGRIALADRRSAQIFFRIVNIGFEVIKVLSWVCRLVLAGFDEPEEAGGEDCAQEWADPVDPMLARKGAVRYAGAEAPRRVKRSTGIVYSYAELASYNQHGRMAGASVECSRLVTNLPAQL
jgi:hypothetical protein